MKQCGPEKYKVCEGGTWRSDNGVRNVYDAAVAYRGRRGFGGSTPLPEIPRF
jgi:hypothetical protein